MSSDDPVSVEALDSDAARAFADRRTTFESDPYRPDYHFVPPGGLLHDPNGAVYWNGRYHLFYQFWPPDVPADRDWSEAMHWGHAVSEDLVHWRDLPVALAPDPGPERGCYSGQALAEDDRVVLLYFGTESGISLATAEGPLLTDVEKSSHNPVVPIDEDAPYEVFDPEVWREGDTYYSLSGWLNGDRTAEYLFESTDLVEWEYLHPLVDDVTYTDPGEDGAVPNFFELDGRHVLLFFSHPRGPQYFVGEYDAGAHEFDIETHGRLNHGPVDMGNLHAPSVLEDDRGRRVAFFNVVEGRSDWRDSPGTGWAGVVSLPRRLSLVDGDLALVPVDEVTALRGTHRQFGPREVPANGEWVVPDVAGRALEVRATVDPGAAQQVELSVLRSPDGDERTTVSFWPGTDALGVDTGRSTGSATVVGRPPEVAPLELHDGEPLDLRVFVDHSVVEVFANGRRTLTVRTYPGSPDSERVSLGARRGRAHLESMDVWEMGCIWDDDE